MNSWQGFVITLIVQITAVTAIALLALQFLRRSAPLRYALAATALLFLLASPALTLILPRAIWFKDASSRAAPNGTTAVEMNHIQTTDMPLRPTLSAATDNGNPVVAPHVIANQVPTMHEQAASPVIVQSLVEQTADSGFAPLLVADWPTWRSRVINLACGVWLVGVAVMIRRFLLARRQLRSLAASVQLDALPADAAEAAQTALGLPQLPPIAISDLTPLPVVLGCWRPLVVLPRQFVETASSARLRDVLIHECAHILRGDPAIHALQQLAGILFWPHPGVHWLNREINHAREEVCDNFVLRCADAADYAQTLLEVAERYGGARLALSLLGLPSRRWSLEERISGILNPRRKKMTRANRITPFLVALVFGATSVLVGGIGARGQVANPAATPPAVEAKGAVPADHPPAIAAGAKKITAHGICTDQHSDPIANVRVRVFWLISYDQPMQLAAEVKTDGDGKFSIPGVATLPADPHHRENFTGLVVLANAPNHVSAMQQLDEVAEGWAALVLDDNPGTLSGVVTDENGKPVQGVTVYQDGPGEYPAPDWRSAVTDDQGRYAIADLNRWNSKDTETVDPKTGIHSMVATCAFQLIHPQYAHSHAMYTAIPQEVNVKLSPPAIVEGTVIDQVTGQPLANAEVCAQGVARSGWHTTRTDANGHYRLLMNKDHYNIWAEADERIAIAVKATWR